MDYISSFDKSKVDTFHSRHGLAKILIFNSICSVHIPTAGYNYFGNERMYSGVDGREFEADIFFGVVYYQRLRHMVSDKFQVRTTGPINILTHQPVKGRKRAGGIRFGEMERDSLLAHGSSFLLQDRLLNCSDRSFVSDVCYNILKLILCDKDSRNVDPPLGP